MTASYEPNGDVTLADEPPDGTLDPNPYPEWLTVKLWNSPEVWVTCSPEQQTGDALWVGAANEPEPGEPRVQVYAPRSAIRLVGAKTDWSPLQAAVRSAASDGIRTALGDISKATPSIPGPPTATNERQLPLFLTVEEAAAILRLPNRKALYAKIERGQVEGVVRQGSKILFDRDAFLRGLKRGSK